MGKACLVVGEHALGHVVGRVVRGVARKARVVVGVAKHLLECVLGYVVGHVARRFTRMQYVEWDVYWDL